MKKLIIALLGWMPLVALAASLTITWDPYPTQINGQVIQNGVMHVQCRTGQNQFTEAGTSGLQGPATVNCPAQPGDTIDVIIIPTASNFTTGPASGVASADVPKQVLPQATGVRVQVVQP